MSTSTFIEDASYSLAFLKEARAAIANKKRTKDPLIETARALALSGMDAAIRNLADSCRHAELMLELEVPHGELQTASGG